jgi:hypothetical protein
LSLNSPRLVSSPHAKVDIKKSRYRSSESWQGWIRTSKNATENQALTSPDTEIDAVKIRSDASLAELIDRWPQLSDEIKRALTAVVRTCAGDPPEKDTSPGPISDAASLAGAIGCWLRKTNNVIEIGDQGTFEAITVNEAVPDGQRKASRAECFRGVRMWASFGGLDYCRVRDVEVESNWSRTYRALKISLGQTFTQLRWWQKKCAIANVERYLPWHFGLSGVRPLPG